MPLSNLPSFRDSAVKYFDKRFGLDRVRHDIACLRHDNEPIVRCHVGGLGHARMSQASPKGFGDRVLDHATGAPDRARQPAHRGAPAAIHNLTRPTATHGARGVACSRPRSSVASRSSGCPTGARQAHGTRARHGLPRSLPRSKVAAPCRPVGQWFASDPAQTLNRKFSTSPSLTM